MVIKRLRKVTKSRKGRSMVTTKKPASSCSRIVEIPNGVIVEKKGNNLVVKGPKGELSRELKNFHGKVEISGNKVTFSSESDRRRSKAIVGTLEAVLKNMVRGVTEGWECQVKVVHSHFPPKLSVKDNEVVIGNFLGERQSRKAKIVQGVSVKIDKDVLVITGVDKEKVGQVGANIEKATKITGFDRRVFQDGCYIIKKPGE